MDVIVYYSIIFDNWAYQHDLSWRIIDVYGKASREKPLGKHYNGGRYGMCCPNSQGYRGYTRDQIEDFCSSYDFEGVFFDMTFWPDICYCKSCRERYSLEVGGEMPTIIDWNDLKWVGFQKKREEWLAEFAQFTTDTVRKVKPNATVNHQFSTILHPWWRAVTDGLMKASDYAGGDCSGMNAYPAGENLQKQLLLRLSLQSGISIL